MGAFVYLLNAATGAVIWATGFSSYAVNRSVMYNKCAAYLAVQIAGKAGYNG